MLIVQLGVPLAIVSRGAWACQGGKYRKCRNIFVGMPLDNRPPMPYTALMDNTNPNELPDDWYLDMAYEDRFECLGDAECDPYLYGELHQDPNQMYDE